MPVTITTPTIIDVQDDAGLSSARRQTIERITTSDDAVVILSTDKNIEVNTYEDVSNNSVLTQFNTVNSPAGIEGAVQIRAGNAFGSANGLVYDPITNSLSANALRTDNLQYANGYPWQAGSGSGIAVQVNNTTVFPSNVSNILVVSWNSGNASNNGVQFTSPGNGQVQASLFSTGSYSVNAIAAASSISVGNVTFYPYAGAPSQSYTLPSSRPNSTLFLSSSNTGEMSWGDPGVANRIQSNATQLAILSDGNIGIDVNGNANVIYISNSVTTFNRPLTANSVVTVNSNLYANASTVRANILTANIINGVIGNTSSSQPNITAVGTLGNLLVSGTVLTNQLTANAQINANAVTGNFASFANTITANTLVSNVNASLANISVSGTAAFTGNVNLGAVANLRITGGNAGDILRTDGSGGLSWISVPVPTTIANGNSSVGFDTANGNIIFTSGGVANLVRITNTGVFINGGTIINATFQVNSTSTLANVTAGNLAVTGNATVTANITANNITATANITAGNANLGNLARANFITVTSNTSTANLAATGNVTFTGAAVNLGAVANLRISGGNSGQILSTDGNSNLSWQTLSFLANGTSNVAIPTASGNVNISAAGTANVLVVTGTGANITGNISVSGNTNLNGTNTRISGNLVLLASTGNTLSIRTSANTTANFSLILPNTAGSDTQVLSTDGTGNLYWTDRVENDLINGNSNIIIGNSAPIILNPQGTANVLVASSTGVSVTGNVSVSNSLVVTSNVTASNLAVVTNTSLVNVTVSGNAAFSGANVSLGNVANLKITGGTNNFVLSTDGNGNVNWTNRYQLTVTPIATSSYTANLTTDIIITVSTEANTLIYLPTPAANIVGRTLVVKDILGANRTTFPITVEAAIDGAANFQITEPYNSVTVACLSATTWGII